MKYGEALGLRARERRGAKGDVCSGRKGGGVRGWGGWEDLLGRNVGKIGTATDSWPVTYAEEDGNTLDIF